MLLEHVNLTVSDLDRSIAFYCDLLDLHVRWKGADRRRAGSARTSATIASTSRCFRRRRDGEVEHDYLRPGVNHFGFVVDDLDDARRRVTELGRTIHLEADYEPGRRIYFMDPDGYEVELVAY